MSNNLIEVEESFDGVISDEQEPVGAVAVANEDFDSLEHEAVEYEQRQTEKKVAPVVKEAVSEAVKYQNDKLKAEVNEVLQSEVGYHLSKYEKRRRRRDVKDKLGIVIKWVVVIGIIAFIYGTPQLRIKFAILFRDFGDLIEGMLNNEEVSSNQLVEDALSNLGVELNESDGVDIDSQESHGAELLE